MLGAASVIVDDKGRVLLDRLTGVYWEPAIRAHHFVFRARVIGTPRVADPAEITEIGWFSPDDLPRPFSDFTMRRIADGLTDQPIRVHQVGPRVWLR